MVAARVVVARPVGQRHNLGRVVMVRCQVGSNSRMPPTPAMDSCQAGSKRLKGALQSMTRATLARACNGRVRRPARSNRAPTTAMKKALRVDRALPVNCRYSQSSGSNTIGSSRPGGMSSNSLSLRR